MDEKGNYKLVWGVRSFVRVCKGCFCCATKIMCI